jgi:hypothetical protein
MSKSHSTAEETLEGLRVHGTKFEYFVYRYRRWLALDFFLVALLGTFILTWPPPGLREARMMSGLQGAHALGLALYAYAQDHKGHYPEGKTSTEVFQKLMDGGYVTDPSIFYLRMSGKTLATGKVLRPENVCWDFTAGTQPNDPSNVPLLYSTGCKVDYAPGKKVRVPENSPYGSIGMAAFYANETAGFITTQDGEAQLFGQEYDPKGKSYVQLTP